MRELDVPLYVRIRDSVREQIITGALGPGTRLPTEQDLIREHGAARGTVRQAMAGLRAEGLITGRRGRGMFVRAEVPEPERETVYLGGGDLIIGRMPTPQEKASLGLDDGVGVMVVYRAAGTTEMYAADRTRFVAKAA